jgi:hypothetical protein
MPLVSLPGGQLRDEIRNPLYDSDDQLPGQSPVGITRFFSSITNPDGSPKGLEQSNLVQANSLPTATSFRCQGYSMDCQSYYEANRQLLPIVQDHSSIQLQVGEKVYATLAWVYLGGRIEVNQAISTTVAATTEERQYQKFGQSAVAPVVLTGKHVIDILPIQQFSAIWNCQGLTPAEVLLATPAAATFLRYYFAMKGLLRRAVQ